MSPLRALVALGVAAAVAGVSLALVSRWTSGWGTVQGICGTVVGTTLLLMVLMARAGQAAAVPPSDPAPDDEGGEVGDR